MNTAEQVFFEAHEGELREFYREEYEEYLREMEAAGEEPTAFGEWYADL